MRKGVIVTTVLFTGRHEPSGFDSHRTPLTSRTCSKSLGRYVGGPGRVLPLPSRRADCRRRPWPMAATSIPPLPPAIPYPTSDSPVTPKLLEPVPYPLIPSEYWWVSPDTRIDVTPPTPWIGAKPG